MKKIIILLSAILCFIVVINGKEPIQLGHFWQFGDAKRFNTEFLRYGRQAPFFKKHGIAISLLTGDALLKMGSSGIYAKKDWTEEKIYQELKKYHVIHLGTTYEPLGTNDWNANKTFAEKVGRALKRYVEDGGGLFIAAQPVRYPHTDTLKYWNIALKPLGMHLEREGIYDQTGLFEAKFAHTKLPYWYTKNIKKHPVTKDVKGLWLPVRATGGAKFPYMPLVTYSPAWTIIVNGEKTAKSYVMDEGNNMSLTEIGTCKEYAPIVAVRTLGKGRIVSYPLNHLFTGDCYGNPFWEHTVEYKGDPSTFRPSDSMKMQINGYKWLAENVKKDKSFGTYRAPVYRRITFPKSIDWDKYPFPEKQGEVSKVAYPDHQVVKLTPPATQIYKGIAGIHSTYSDGSGTVAEYADAAKKAGLSFIVFNDSLEMLTPEELNNLKADCKKVTDDSFFAVPGIEFTDGVGIRWAFWGNKVMFPRKTIENDGKNYVQWDGKVVRHFGEYSIYCGEVPTGSAVLNYKELKAKGLHPEKLWWFHCYLPFVYDNNKKIADNFQDYLDGLHDLRWATVGSYNRIKSPKDVKTSAATCFTGYRDLAQAKVIMNGSLAKYYQALYAGQFVSQGPEITQWQQCAAQMEFNWQQTRGAQRVRLKFTVRSDDGIDKVIVHDQNRKPIRVFTAKGAKEFSQQFEVVNSNQRELVLEVIDTKGKRAISEYILVFAYKGGLFRCGDNLNLLGYSPVAPIHPDRNQGLNINQAFGNTGQFVLPVDGGQSMCPLPSTLGGWYLLDIKGVGRVPESPYKSNKVQGILLDTLLNSHCFQILQTTSDHFSERYCTKDRPQPALASTPRDLGENEYFKHIKRSYYPRARVNLYTSLNYRRPKEGASEYEGGFVWNEGEIHFKKDVTLHSNWMPICIMGMQAPFRKDIDFGDTVIVTDAKRGTRVIIWDNPKKARKFTGRIKPGGYLTQQPNLAGYLAFMPPIGNDFIYKGSVPGGRIYMGLGHNGQKFKAGDVLKYSYVIGTFTDAKPGNDLLEHTVKALNMGGGQNGYPIKVKSGKIVDAVFFCTAQAEKNEASFALGPQKLIIDLPIRVKGLEDNGCTAVYTSKRPWFRFVPMYQDTAYFQEPIDQKNDIWVGNIFVCENSKDVKMTVVVDGQSPGKKPFIELHNPTDKPINAIIASPPNTPLFGGMKITKKVPANASVKVEISKVK